MSMNGSSSKVIDSVAAELKHYMETQRREEGFDLSGPHEPRRAYPKLKVGSTVNYGRIHDRSLKHYFTPSMIRTHIANLEAVPPGSPRQKSVKRRLTKKMRQLSDNNAFDERLMTQQVSDELYATQMQALNVLHTETQQRLRKKVFTAPPLLRRSVSPKMTRGESLRLVNRSSQILVATETVALAHEILSQRHHPFSRPQSAPANWSNGLPGIYYSPGRPKTARGRIGANEMRFSTPNSHKKKPKYVWDINGRRIRNRSHDEFDDLSSISFSSSSSSVEMETYPKVHGRQYKPARPTSAMALPHKMHFSNHSRPYSAGFTQPNEPLNSSMKTSRYAVSPDSGFCVDAKTQTRYRRKPSSRVKQAFASCSESERESCVRKYEVEISTGDRLGAGTSADVYLSLHGEEGDTDEIYLTKPVSSDKKRKPFRRGQTDIFRIETENVGNLIKIGVGHDQKRKGFSWFVDRVIVRDDEKSWKFHCKTWLSGTFSKKKTFRHFSLDHEPSESSDSSSDSSLSASESESAVVRRRKSSRPSISSSSSSATSSSRTSATGPRKLSSSSEKELDQTPPVFSVQPPTPLSSGHTFEVRTSSRSGSVSSRSALEYSSDSSSDERESAKINESFVEESEDTHAQLSSSSSSTLTDVSDNDVTVSAGNTKPTKSAPFSIDSFFRAKSPEKQDDSSSDESKSSSSSVMRKNEDKSSSDSDSGSSDESTPRNEERSAKPPPKLKKQFSKVISLSAIESANQLPSPSLATAEESTVPDETIEVSQVKNHQVMEALEPGNVDDSSDSDTDSTRSDDDFSTSSKDSSVVKEAILERDSSEEFNSVSDGKLFTENATDSARDVTKEAESESHKVGESQTLLEDDNDALKRRSSSSSSSSSDNEEAVDKDDATLSIVQSPISEYGHVTKSGTAAEEEANETNNTLEGQFTNSNARRLSLTAQLLLHDQGSKSFEIEESLQSDEEGIVEPPSLPAVRGDVHDLIKEGEIDKVIEILVLRPELKEKVNENGLTPLHMASNRGVLQIVQWLAASGANLKAETPTGYTAMHMAAMNGHVACVKVLYAMGADVNALNIDGQTSLHLSCMSGQLESVTCLVEIGADLHIRDSFDRTALDLSKQSRHHDVTVFLKNHLRSLKKNNSVTSPSESSLESMKRSFDSSSSSSSEEELPEDTGEQPNVRDVDQDTVAATLESDKLEKKKKLYEKQQKMMKRRRSSFLDMIRAETEESPKRSSSSSSSSDSEDSHVEERSRKSSSSSSSSHSEDQKRSSN